VLKQAPRPLQTTQEILSKEDNCFIICDPLLAVDKAKEIYFKTGRHPIEFNWLLDSVSCYQLLVKDKYKLALLPDHPFFETQNSLAY
jgi:hypothetical protein